MKSLTVSSIFISLVCVVVVAGLVNVVNLIWIRPKKQEKWLKQQGIPGTCYRILYGDFKNMSSMRTQAMAKPITGFSHDYVNRIDPFLHQLVTKFGKEFFMWFGPYPVMYIFKPELIREVFSKLQVFQKPHIPIIDKLFPGLVSYEGEQWAQHRKMLNPAFHTEKLKLMLPAFYETCSETINKWEMLVAKEGSGEVDVWPYLVTFSADTISRAAFGSRYTEGQKIFQLLKEQIDLGIRIMQSPFVYVFRYLPTATNRRFNEKISQIENLLTEVIDKRKKAMDDGDEAKDDLLGILLDSNMKEIQQADVTRDKKHKHGISLQEVIDECKLFYLGGQETTSILLVWTLILLSKHQDWQTRAREEVLDKFENNAPHFEGLSHLKIVTMILHEVLRMYPPTANLTRRINEDTKLGELSLLEGAFLSVPVAYIHRDKEIWGEDAEEFRPERFSEGITKATRGNNAFFPFGAGPRICIGEKFAMNEVKMALAMILQRFSLELSPSYVHAPTTIFFLQPQHGAQIIIHKLR